MPLTRYQSFANIAREVAEFMNDISDLMATGYTADEAEEEHKVTKVVRKFLDSLEEEIKWGWESENEDVKDMAIVFRIGRRKVVRWLEVFEKQLSTYDHYKDKN